MNLIEKNLDADGILTLTLNRPEKLNVLNDDTLVLLSKIFEEAKIAKEIKGLIITGTGKAFCAGADIRRLAECTTQIGYEFAREGQDIFRLLETLGKPSLAAINGYAFGGGCELAMAATIRIASPTAQFGQPEVKLGVIPGYGGTQRLPRLVGKGRALDLCLTGRFISAETALNWGLITDLVESEVLLEKAKERLKTILAMAPLAVKSIMELIDSNSNGNDFQMEALHFALTCASADKKEGVGAFLESRKPQFQGV